MEPRLDPPRDPPREIEPPRDDPPREIDPREIDPPEDRPKPPRLMLGLDGRDARGDEIERDREIPPLDRELLREEMLGLERRDRVGLIEVDLPRDEPARDCDDREILEPEDSMDRDPPSRDEPREVLDRTAELPPRLDDGLTRDAERGTNRPEERPWSAREPRAEEEVAREEFLEPKGV